MNSEIAVDGKKQYSEFSIHRNFLYQYVCFPLLHMAIIFFSLGFFAFIQLFITFSDHVQNLINLNVGTALVAFLVGFILAKRVRAVEPKSAGLNRYAMLFSPAFSALSVLIAYFAGGIFPAKIAAFVSNPLLIVVNFLCDSILENVVVTTALVSSVFYTISFLIFTQKVFHTDNKRYVRKFALISALVFAVSVSVGTFTAYPEVEYEILKMKYDTLQFKEDAEYDFHNNLPFAVQSNLVKTDETLELDFPDVYLTPRLDGATAFYPVYAAVAQSCYSGLKIAIEENALRYFGTHRGNGDNIKLDLAPRSNERPQASKIFGTD